MFPTIIAVIITGVLILLGVILTYRKLSRLLKPETDSNQQVLIDWLKQMQESLERTRATVDQRLSSSQENLVKHLHESNRNVNERLDKASEVISKVQKELGGLAETTGYIKDVYTVLQAPKMRGNIGEQILNDLLKESIPNGKFRLQHTFSSGERVDALIETAEGNIPIDAKFPMESFKRYLNCSNETKEKEARQFISDAKKHVRDIAKKYIQPVEGTVDFAVMYIPSEPVAYEITTVFPEIMECAHQYRVTIVSPNQFFTFLRVIMIGFEKQQVGEQAKQILVALQAIRKEAEKFSDDFDILNKHLTNAKAKADEAKNSFGSLSQKINFAQRLSPNKETELIE